MVADNTVTTRIPRQLRESDTHGKGAAEIGWGSPGDFARCQAFMRRHGVPGHEIDGACANLHKLATGEWPGPNAHGGHHAASDIQALVAAMGPKFKGRRWSGPLAPIGSPTGDGRQFPAGVLAYQTFPMPLAWQEQGLPGHQGAVTVGVIEHAEEKDVEGKRLIWGRGYLLDPKIIPDVTKAEHLIEHGVAGASVDLDSYAAVIRPSFDGARVSHAAKGRIRSATIVRIPAFADLRLQFDDEDEQAPVVTASMAEFSVNQSGWRGAPIAPREAVFDADDAAKRIEAWANGDPNKMAKMFLWVDTESGPLLGRKGYRLPWGDIIDDKPYLIYHAVYAAAALLQDAHGGLPNIPDEQKGHLRTVITEIYQELAKQFDDPSVIAPWDRHDQAQQASGEPEDEDGDDEYLETEEYGGRFREHLHPRRRPVPRVDHGGEWVDVPGHGPHGQIKVGGKWVYPPKRGEKGYRSPETSVRAKAKRGAGKPATKSETRVVRKAKPEPGHKAPAPKKVVHHKAPAAKKVVRHKAPPAPAEHKAPAAKAKAHKVSAAQDKFLEQFRDNETVEADENNVTVRVLEREGYVEKTGTKRAPAAKKTASAKKTPATKKATSTKKATGGEDDGEGGEGEEGGTKKATGTTVAKKAPAAKREKTLHEYRLTQKGRDHLGIKESGHKDEGTKTPETKEPETTLFKRTTLRLARDSGDDGMWLKHADSKEKREAVTSLEAQGLLERNRKGNRTYFKITGKGHEALKGHESEEPETKTPEDREAKLESDIRAFVADKHKDSTDNYQWVRLADVRTDLEAKGYSREEQDAALRKLSRQDDVRVIPAQKADQADHDAALEIGVDENHLISIGARRRTDEANKRKEDQLKGPETKKVETSLFKRLTLRGIRDHGDEGASRVDVGKAVGGQKDADELVNAGLVEKFKVGRADRFRLTDKGHEALKGHEDEEDQDLLKRSKDLEDKLKAHDQKLKAAGKKTTVVRRKTGEAKEHKLTDAQQRGLEAINAGGAAHPGSKKVLQREGYLDEKGNLTDKGLAHLGVEKKTETKVPETKTEVAKKVPEVKKTKEQSDEELVADKLKGYHDLGDHKEVEKLLEGLQRRHLEQIAKEVGIDVHRNDTASDLKRYLRQRKEFDLFNKQSREKSSEHRANTARRQRDVAAAEAASARGPRGKNPAVLTFPKSQSGRDWWDQLTEDTGPEGLRARDVLITGAGGYEYLMKSGTVYRHNGVSYLIEDGDGMLAPSAVAEQFQRVHEGLPSDLSRLQKGYIWARGKNPADVHWAKEYKTRNFTSLATAGDGGVRVWNRDNTLHGPSSHEDTLRHEFGHSVSYGIGRERHHGDPIHNSPEWHGATDADADRHRSWQSEFHTSVLHEGGSSRKVVLGRNYRKGYPQGVTEYGKNSAAEDYAESVALYMHQGQLGYVTRPGGRRLPVYFRDLFPGRAKLLDELFPQLAAEQKRLVSERGPL